MNSIMNFVIPMFLSMWTMSSSGFWANPDGTIYPDSQFMVARTIFIGKMQCAARLLDLSRVQHWCIKVGPSGDVVVRNEIQAIDPSVAVTLSYTDAKIGEPTADVAWIIAFVDGNPRTIAYQVTWSPDVSINAPPKMLSGQF